MNKEYSWTENETNDIWYHGRFSSVDGIKDAWEKARLAYQQRYAKACEEFEESLERDTEFYKGQHKGALLEMSWVLIGIFGLTGKQVDEVERNNGFTNADINRELNGGFA